MSTDRVWSIEIIATTRDGNKLSREIWAKDESPRQIQDLVTSAVDRLMDNLMSEGLL